eukprot:CAMPEP_0117662330 /NCGR_PEP_ID=MMETSP0804-20121206/7998_1 /TAXON_ID=1074897 /ORGANISM="Tetraselmis astigmatica, Strain CCMP880" /LENGTH=929 /DNA_ID=CAMNT_0005469227 /DNA_START=440 /DNA_END=3229 /DNA_ORIENTATION=-
MTQHQHALGGSGRDTSHAHAFLQSQLQTQQYQYYHPPPAQQQQNTSQRHPMAPVAQEMWGAAQGSVLPSPGSQHVFHEWPLDSSQAIYRRDDSTSQAPAPRLNGGPPAMHGSASASRAMSPRSSSRASLFEEGGDDNFKVVVRVRPPLPREQQSGKLYRNTSMVDPSYKVITLSENLPAANSGHKTGMLYATYRYTFDHVYDEQSGQDEVYNHSARSAVHCTLQGYNAAIIAYGQTGTGKTYTMEGRSMNGPERGIIPRAIEDIFITIENDSAPQSKYLVRASYLQIYNEVISDLLKPDKSNLVIREDRKRGVFVDGLSEWVVRSPAEVYSLMERGGTMRTTGATKMNEISSRSHAVFLVIVENCVTLGADDDDSGEMAQKLHDMGVINSSKPRTGNGRAGPTRESVRVGKMNLVDLAGSERVHITGATGKRLEESKKINQSLSALGNVIGALTETKQRQHIPYRDSKLTRILEDSLGGNCKTTMMCMISPALEAFPESLSTLKFANRAKNIRNIATVNEDMDQRTLLKKYERELRRLRQELAQRSKDLVDKRRLLELEEQKKRAEADKLAAITALEQRSREFMVEKEHKRHLEQRINSMQSQLLIGGHKVEDMPAFRSLLKKEQRRIRSEYEERLRELEKERQNVEQDKAQVDRYKHLLLKQRDIMIALTQRLNERDEQILAMQEELEAYDRHQRRLEDALDQKTAELIALRKAAVEHMGTSPLKSTPLQSALGDWGGAEGGGGGAARPPKSPSGGATEAPLNSHWPSEDEAGSRQSSGNLEQQQMVAELELRMEALQARHAAEQSSVGQELEDSSRRVALLEEENTKLRAALAEREADGLQQSAPADMMDLAALREQFANHSKERAALKTILESKIHTLVGDISASMSELQGSSADRQVARMARQVMALDKLVGATINAMRAVSQAQ